MINKEKKAMTKTNCEARTIKNILAAKRHALKYTKRESAFNVSNWVILGDDHKYWVVTPADFERLVRAGYSAA
jgi:hypothetical protein